MILKPFEAIRQLKEGQAIVDLAGGRIFEWKPGCTASMLTPIYNDFFDCRIIDLPKPQPTLYDALLAGAERINASLPCDNCIYKGKCRGMQCYVALIDTLQDIALKAGFDLKKITAEAGEGGE